MGMGMGMGFPTHAIIALVISTAFLVWVNEKAGNPAQKTGKAVAWIGIILSALLLVGQLYMCSKACMSGQCGRSMSKPGMGMMNHMNMPMMPMPSAPEAPESGK